MCNRNYKELTIARPAAACRDRGDHGVTSLRVTRIDELCNHLLGEKAKFCQSCRLHTNKCAKILSIAVKDHSSVAPSPRSQSKPPPLRCFRDERAKMHLDTCFLARLRSATSCDHKRCRLILAFRRDRTGAKEVFRFEAKTSGPPKNEGSLRACSQPEALRHSRSRFRAHGSEDGVRVERYHKFQFVSLLKKKNLEYASNCGFLFFILHNGPKSENPCKAPLTSYNGQVAGVARLLKSTSGGAGIEPMIYEFTSRTSLSWSL